MGYQLGIGTQLFPSKIASLSLEESIKQLYVLRNDIYLCNFAQFFF